MKKDKKHIEINRNLKIALISFVLVLIIGLIIYARNFRNFSTISLMTNNKDYYNINDLVVGKVKYLDKEKTIDKEFGKPKKEKTKIIGSFVYKIKEYDGLKLTLREDYSDFVLVKAEVTSRKYKTGRKLRVGNKITKVMRSYKVSKKKSNYLYGNYPIKALDDPAISKEIYLGYRDTNKVEYIVRDEVTDKSSKMLSKIVYEYKYGKVKKITWSYDVE